MNENVSGVNVPQMLIDELGLVPKERRREKAVEMTTRLISEIAPMVQGVHIMLLGWSDIIIPEIIERATIPGGPSLI
jgi:methylenetetrahydrofolate reductase (NADPH)